MNFFIKKMTLSMSMLLVICQAYGQVNDEFSFANAKRETDRIYNLFSQYADIYLDILMRDKTYPLIEVAWSQLISEQNSKKRKTLLNDFNRKYGSTIRSAFRQSGISSDRALTSISNGGFNTQVEFNEEFGILIYNTSNQITSIFEQLGPNCSTKSGETILQMEFDQENGPAETNGCAQFDGGYTAGSQSASAQCGVEYNMRYLDYEIPATMGCDTRLVVKGKSIYVMDAYAGLGPLNILTGNIVKISNISLTHPNLVHTGRMVGIMLLPFTSTESGFINDSNYNQDFVANIPVHAGENYHFEYITVARVVGARHTHTDAKISSTIKDVTSPRLITYVSS